MKNPIRHFVPLLDDDTTSLPVIPGMGLEYGVADHLKKDDPGK